MASINDVVSLAISRNTATPSRPGFGTPLVLAYHTRYTDRVRAYSDPSGMLPDGFLVTDAAYKAVSAAFAQNPRPAQVKVGRRALAPTQIVTLAPSNTQGDIESGTIVGPTGIVYNYSYTVTAGQTVAQVCTALAGVITALAIPAFTAVASATVVTCTGTTPGQLFDHQNVSATIAIQNITTDPGIATDFAAVRAVDDDWYGIALDSNSKAEVVALAAAVETAGLKVFVAQSQDSDCTTSATTDVLSTLKNASYTRTLTVYHHAGQLSCIGSALLGKLLPQQPGSVIAGFKTLATITVDNLSTTAQNNVRAKNGNDYQAIASLGNAQTGAMASGDWLDIIVGLDWLAVNTKLDLFAVEMNVPKLPFTDSGGEVLRSAVLGRLLIGEGFDPPLLAKGSSSATATPVAQQSTADRAARRFNKITFQTTLAGAIQSVVVNGSVSV